MAGKARDELSSLLRRLALARVGQRANPEMNISPGCPFGVTVRERLQNMEQEIREVKGRVNALIFTIIGAVVLDIASRLMKW